MKRIQTVASKLNSLESYQFKNIIVNMLPVHPWTWAMSGWNFKFAPLMYI